MPTSKDDLKQLTILGHETKKSDVIEVFPNHAPGKLNVSLHVHEFTCLCPLTGQPDYATIDINYTPDQWLAETKSVKLFLLKYRNTGIFHEHLAVDLGEEFVRFVQPLKVDVVVHFKVRGGISVDAEFSNSSTSHC
ncbi:preQ(1) synthase [bacterium]|nr:preQ(1) synthase [bacterium]